MKDPRFSYGGRHHADNVKDAPALEIQSLSVGYPGESKPVIEGIALSLPPGSRMALVGPNGSGKSTLLKACAGLLPVRSGSIRVYGNPAGSCHHRVAYLAQRSDIEWNFPMSVARLVMSGRYVHLGWFSLPKKEDWEIVNSALGLLDLGDLAKRQIGELSGGQQQRTLLARALVQEADLLLLDEPLNALDKDSRAAFNIFLAELKCLGKTAVVATHYYDKDSSDFDSVFYMGNSSVH